MNSNNSILIKHDDKNLEFTDLPPHSIITGDLRNIELPYETGDYLLRVEGNDAKFIRPPYNKPIQLQATFLDGDNYIESKYLKWDKIPNGVYLMLFDSEIYTDEKYTSTPSYAEIEFKAQNDDQFFYKSNLNSQKNKHISAHAIVSVDYNILGIHTFADFCSNYKYKYANVTLIPIV